MKLLPFSVLAALALLAGCSKAPSDSSAAAPLPAVSVSVGRVTTTDSPALTEVTGTVRPAQRAAVAAKVMGSISDLPVTLGQRVATGDLLLKIFAPEISARVAQARAQLNVVERDLQRERELLKKGASTTDTVRGLEDRHALTTAQLREAETMFSYTELRAPFDGVVARRLVDVGDLAAPGQPLLEVEGIADFQIEAGIPDSLLSDLTVGRDLLVEPAAGASFRAAVIELSSAADPAARTVTAKLAVPAGTVVRSGQFVRVHVPAGQTRGLRVPAAAVSRRGQMERVFVHENGRASLRLVRTGATHEGLTEIVAGLVEGETVVLNPPAALREGQPLEPKS